STIRSLAAGQVLVTQPEQQAAAKVPEVLLLFWPNKTPPSTLGEPGADPVSMSMNLGYLEATAIFAVIVVAAVTAQIAVQRFSPALYWTTIIATTTVGTTLADFATRSLGIGYSGGRLLLLALVLEWLPGWFRGRGP